MKLKISTFFGSFYFLAVKANKYLVLLLLTFSAFCFGQNTNLAQNVVPRFENSACLIELPKGENTVCGFLVVPENRSLKNSLNIRLPIIILKSSNPNPQPDPIAHTLGGPGVTSLRMGRGRRIFPWLKNRDVIIFEQRGTRFSQPALECSEVDEANINSAKKRLDARTAKQREIKAAKKCYDRLSKKGINLSAYNSKESAADIEDLRRVLKVEKLNLYGVSYSARLMLTVLRYYPNSVRSIVLESTLPPQVNYDEVGVDNVVDSLNSLFTNCKNDSECSKAFPNLENEFYESVNKLNKMPYSVSITDSKTNQTDTVLLNGFDFLGWVVDFMLSNNPEAIAAAPLQINKVFQGNYESFKEFAESKLSSAGYAWGMRYSVWCGEEIPFENRNRIKAQSFLYSKIKGLEIMSIPDICRVWKVSPAKSLENQFVKSDVPTLFIAGEYDAYTPTSWAKQTSDKLKNSFVFEVPWHGHVPTNSSPACLREMIADFFDKPNIAPKSECLNEIKQLFKFEIKR